MTTAARFGVSDYRWFNLRDADSAPPALFQHFGLLRVRLRPEAGLRGLPRLVRELGGKARVRP